MKSDEQDKLRAWIAEAQFTVTSPAHAPHVNAPIQVVTVEGLLAALASGDGSESAGLRERLAWLVAEWRAYAKKVGGIATTPYHDGMRMCADALEAALAPAISRCDVYTELCKPETDIKLRLECVREVGHKEPHAYEFPTWPSNLEPLKHSDYCPVKHKDAPAISRPPTQGSAERDCACRLNDAWRCAVDRQLRSIACPCACHHYLEKGPAR